MSRGIERPIRAEFYTRAGSPVRIFVKPGNDSSEYIGAYWGKSEKWIPVTWDRDGFYLGKDKPCALDIMLKPEEKELACLQKNR